MKVFPLIAAALLLFGAFGIVSAQKSDDWWKMPGTQKANPPKRTESPATKNSVEWTFPVAGQNSMRVNGETFYELTPEIFAKRTAIGDSKEIEAAAVYFSPKMLAIIQLSLKTERGDPDYDRFLIWTAVHLAIKDPGNTGFHRYIGESVMYGLLFRVFQLTSGQFIAAHIADDERYIIILPGPKT